MVESYHWINGALVAATAIAISYWFTWSSDRELDMRKLFIMGLITFIAALGGALLGDAIIKWMSTSRAGGSG